MNSKYFLIRTRIALYLASLIMMTQTSCKKFVDIPPPAGDLTETTVFNSDATAISALTDFYRSMNGYPIQGAGAVGSIALTAGLAADEYQLNDGVSNASYAGYYSNTLTQLLASPMSGSEHWAPLYNFIFRCNAAIEGLVASTSLTPSIKDQLLGEAKFMRAYFYFYLVNMFGDVPLVMTTDPEVNTLLVRSPGAEVYDQIKTDLQEAEQLLSNEFLDGTLLTSTAERVRPTKWAAAALLARVYLHTSEWEKAEIQSTKVINNSGLFNLSASLNDVFLKNSSEAIFQIQPIYSSFNTLEALALILPESGPTPGNYDNPVQLSRFLVNSFDSADNRKIIGNWIGSVTVDTTTYYFPYKYKVYLPNDEINPDTRTDNMTEYFMLLRLAEQFLIRAEARAHLGKVAESQSDLNAIRNRAGLDNTTAADTESLLDAILRERQHELFTEGGFRWFDLKRTGHIDEVMSVVTPIKSIGMSSWHSYQQLYPLPFKELQRAPNLRQNPGY